MKKRILSGLLTIAMALTLLPTAALAVNMNEIHGGDCFTEGDEIYFGTYTENDREYNVPWIVLPSGALSETSVAEDANVLPLLSQYLLGTSKFRADLGFYNQRSVGASVEVSSSVLKETMENYYNGANTLFKTAEQNAVADTTLLGSSMCTDQAELPGQKLFPLSDTEKDKVWPASRPATDFSSAAGSWWLRSSPNNANAKYLKSDGSSDSDTIGADYGVRPAFNLDFSKVLLASAAEGGKTANTLAAVGVADITAWKLTLQDDSRSAFTAATTAVSDNTLTISYSGAATGTNEYISAMIKSSTGDIKCYGRIAQPTAAKGTVQIDLTDKMIAGDTLYVFNEQCNGDYKTDYASSPIAVRLDIEQFDLATGETYYFDLSGAGIPGTVNEGNEYRATSVPDPTLTWVPFTYAGTVNAYVLNEKSSDVSDSSAKAAAAADPDADYGYCYNHSLFVADYNVKYSSGEMIGGNFSGSWASLNSAELIFGKAYESGGVSYTLRAPSAGSGSTGTASDGSDNRSDPTANEWDTILNKGVAIENFTGIYSFGQDTRTAQSSRMARGNLSDRNAISPSPTTWGTDFGYRPVLEVPGGLASDALKAVTLDLNGGSVDGKLIVSIIVKNGASYSAPSDAGLTQPTGIISPYFAWRGDNGSTYAPGDLVPAEVTALTALWVDGVVVGDFVVKGGVEGEDYDYQVGAGLKVLGVLTDTPLTISMKPGVDTTTSYIVVTKDVCADITLAGVDIATGAGAPLDFRSANTSKLTLAAGTINDLKSTGSYPGICLGVAKLTIGGKGTLVVYGGARYPGIGGIGGIGNEGGTTLQISSGTINAYGGTGAAGIGGCAFKNGGTITINDGIINAYGGAATDEYGSGAGIGGGARAVVDYDIITINGGTIYAKAGTSNPNYTWGGNAGIGGGAGGYVDEYSGCRVIINGGVITAEGSSDAYGAGAGIGASGDGSFAKDITITGGVINATAGANGAAGIGGGGDNGVADGELTSFAIGGGFITATGTRKLDGSGNANAIGGGAAKPPADLSAVRGAVIIDGAAKTGSVYGSALLKQTAKVPADVTLTIPEGAFLTIGEGGRLNIYGVVRVGGALGSYGGYIMQYETGDTQYAVKWNLTNVTHDKGEGVTYASWLNGYTAKLTAVEGHTLPTSVTVTMNETTLTYDGYTYDKDTGALSIDPYYVIGKVEITAAAEQPSSGATYYTVTASAGAGGSISPSGAVSVRRGRDKTFTITPEDGYAIGDVLLDGVSVKTELTGGSYTLRNITRRHSLSVTFVKSGPFTDVKESDWFFEDVLYVYENKLMLGTSANTFSPHAPTTRGMLVTILYGLAGSPSIEDEIWGYPFADVDVEEYYGTAIYWARLNGVVGGYDAEHFGPNDPVTREQLAAILYRYAQYKGYQTGASAEIGGFEDAGAVSSYAVPALQWACGSGLLQGSDGKLMPRGSAERCQVAAILQQFCERIAQ